MRNCRVGHRTTATIRLTNRNGHAVKFRALSSAYFRVTARTDTGDIQLNPPSDEGQYEELPLEDGYSITLTITVIPPKQVWLKIKPTPKGVRSLKDWLELSTAFSTQRIPIRVIFGPPSSNNKLPGDRHPSEIRIKHRGASQAVIFAHQGATQGRFIAVPQHERVKVLRMHHR